MSVRLVMSVCLALAVFVSSVHAGIMYRYKDDQGRTVMAATVPPEIVPKGYEVLNAQGRVVEKVPPALTAEQIRARDEAIEKKKREEEARKAQEAEDQRLLKQYGSPQTVVNLLKRRLSEIDSVIVSRQASIAANKNAIAENEELAANAQRNGRKVSTRVTEALEKSRGDIAKAQSVILEKKHDRERIIKEFSEIIQRLEQLTGKKASEYM
jgi:hypothetical protein